MTQDEAGKDSGRPGLTRRAMIGGIAAGTGGTVLAACSANQQAASGGSTPSVGGQPWAKWVSSFYKKPVKIAVTCYNTTNPYFAPSKAGTEDAGGQLGIETTWTGSPSGSTTDQISQFNDLVNSGYQAIVVIPGEADPWVAPINQAVAKGVVVCTANSDSPQSKRELYFGQDLYSAAVIQGQMLAKLAGSKGTVAMTNCAPGLLALDQRMAGAKHGVTSAGMSVVGVYNTNPSDPASELSTIGDIMKAHPNLTALMPLCGPDTSAAAQVKQQVGGKFPIVGTDLLPQTLSYIKSGVVQGTVGQHPYLQAYMPIMYCYQRVVLQAPKLGLPGGNYYLSNEVVTTSNVDYYLTREARFKG